MRAKKEINIQIGSNIQRLREEARLTQEALSEMLGLTPNHLSAIERGVSGISLENLHKLCRCLGISADSVLFGDPASEEELLIANRIASLPPEQKQQVYKILWAVIALSDVSEKEHQKPRD